MPSLRQFQGRLRRPAGRERPHASARPSCSLSGLLAERRRRRRGWTARAAFGTPQPRRRRSGRSSEHLPVAGLVVIAERLPRCPRRVEFFIQGSSIGDLGRRTGHRRRTPLTLDRRRNGARRAQAPRGRERAAARREGGGLGRISPEGKKRVVEALKASIGRYVAEHGRRRLHRRAGNQAAPGDRGRDWGADRQKSAADLALAGEASSPRCRRWPTKAARSSGTCSGWSSCSWTSRPSVAFLILSIGLTPVAYPVLPRHLTLAAPLAVGIPRSSWR